MKTHKTTIKAINDMIGLYPRAISRALYQLREIGFIEFNDGKKLKKGGNFVVHIKQLLFNFEKDSYLKKDKVQESSNKLQESSNKLQESSNKVQKEHNPRLPKEIYKETSKETIKDSFEELDRAWFLTYKGSDSFNKILSKKFDKYYVKTAFDSLSLEQQEQVILSVKKYIQYLKNNPQNIKYMKKASNFIIEEEWKKYYQSIMDEIKQEKKSLEHRAYLKEADENKAPEEWRKNFLQNLKDDLKRKEMNNER